MRLLYIFAPVEKILIDNAHCAISFQWQSLLFDRVIQGWHFWSTVYGHLLCIDNIVLLLLMMVMTMMMMMCGILLYNIKRYSVTMDVLVCTLCSKQGRHQSHDLPLKELLSVCYTIV